MRKHPFSRVSHLLLFLLLLLLVTSCFKVEAQACKPSGKIRGKKPPPGACNRENDSECCVEGRLYATYKCSPHVSGRTKALLTLNGFEEGGDGGAESACNNKYHLNDTPVVALSTGWFNNHRGACITSPRARTIMCDSTIECDSDHDYQPSCPNNHVDASRAVWKALGIPKRNWGELDIFWSDA